MSTLFRNRATLPCSDKPEALVPGSGFSAAPKGPEQMSPGQRPGCEGTTIPVTLKGHHTPPKSYAGRALSGRVSLFIPMVSGALPRAVLSLPPRGECRWDAAPYISERSFLGLHLFHLHVQFLDQLLEIVALAEWLEPRVVTELVGVVEARGDVVAKGLDRPVRGMVDARLSGRVEARVR